MLSARPSDPGLALLHALIAGSPRACAVELVDMTSTAWASATFTGMRHVFRLQGHDAAALSDWLAGLPEATFRLRGHLVADVAVTSVERRDGAAGIILEALTVEEA